MKHYAFLLLPEFSNLCLANSVEALNAANKLCKEQAYQVSLVSIDGSTLSSYSGFSAPITGNLDDVIEQQPDILFVLASYNYQKHTTKEVVQRLKHAARKVPIIAGLDAGSYIMAKAGLLDNHKATIHWTEAEVFQESFPKIEVCFDRYIIDGSRITSGGSASVMDLILRLIRLDCGESLAMDVADLFIFDTERPGNVHQKDHVSGRMEERSPRVAKAIKMMEKHIESPVGIETIASLVGISQRQLERDFKEVIHSSISKHYSHLRITSAQRLLRETNMSITEVALRCGYQSLASLNRTYRQAYECTPTEERKRNRT